MLTDNDTDERCGVITAEGEVVELANVHDTPKDGFRVAPADALIWLAGEKAVSTWHTHPGGDPNLSEQDYAGFLQWPDLTHWIVGLRDGEPLALEYAVDNGLVLAK